MASNRALGFKLFVFAVESQGSPRILDRVVVARLRPRVVRQESGKRQHAEKSAPGHLCSKSTTPDTAERSARRLWSENGRLCCSEERELASHLSLVRHIEQLRRVSDHAGCDGHVDDSKVLLQPCNHEPQSSVLLRGTRWASGLVPWPTKTQPAAVNHFNCR